MYAIKTINTIFYVVVTIDITSTSGTAISGEDFTPLTQITFTDDQTRACANVQISANDDDNIDDDDFTESFTLSINTNQQDDVDIGTPDVTTIYITDDEHEDGKLVK